MNKIYCGAGKEFGRYNTLSISICLDDIPQEYIKTAKNGKKYINLNIDRKRQTDKYGKTHSVSVNTWTPNQNNNDNLGF